MGTDQDIIDLTQLDKEGDKLKKMRKKDRERIIDFSTRALESNRCNFIINSKMNNPVTRKPFVLYEEYYNSNVDKVERDLLRLRAKQLAQNVNSATLKGMTVIADFFLPPTQRKFNFGHEAYVKMLQDAQENIMWDQEEKRIF